MIRLSHAIARRSDDARGARRPLRRDRRQRSRCSRASPTPSSCACSTPPAPRRASRWSSTRASSGAAASTACGPARATATASTDRMTRRRALAAIRPSCCSTPTRGRSPAAVQWNDAVDGDDAGDSAPYVPRSVVCDDAFDWSGERRAGAPRWRTRSSTSCTSRASRSCHPQVPARAARHLPRAWPTPAVTDHLLGLGVTAVELLPVHQFVHDRFLADRGLRNYWGYQSIGYFAPAQRVRARPTTAAARSRSSRRWSVRPARGRAAR